MTKSFLLSKNLFKHLEDFSQGSQDKLSIALLGAFAILIYRTQEQSEVRIATSPAQLSSNSQQWQVSFSKELTVRQLLNDLQEPFPTWETSSPDAEGIYY